MTEETISLRVLNKFPRGCTVLRASTCEDRPCFVVLWTDNRTKQPRLADFCAATGDYLGDRILHPHQGG